MKKISSIVLLFACTVLATGCSSTPTPTTPTVPAAVNADPLLTASTNFAAEFKACENNPSSCDLARDGVIEGRIDKIYDPNYWDLSNFVDVIGSEWTKSTIPLLPDSQQKRSTIIVNESWEVVAFENIKVWDQVKVNIKSFDRIEAGQLTEKLGQYGYIQVSTK